MLKNVFDEISKTENCRILPFEEIRQIPVLKQKKDVIEITTDLSLASGHLSVTLYLVLEKSELPKIYIEQESYDIIKYIPHVNSDLSLCVIESESINFKEEDLPQIAGYLIHLAKKILSIKPEDKNEEFEDEFKAYWELPYGSEGLILERGMVLITNDSPIKCIKFASHFNFFSFLLYTDSIESTRLFNFFDLLGIKYSEILAIQIDYDKVAPPFNLSFIDSVKFFSEDQQNHFKRKINKDGLSSILVFFRNSKLEFYGWVYDKFHPELKNKIISSYNYSYWEKIKLPIYRQSQVKRLSFANITDKRLAIRTAGHYSPNSRNVCLIGLGSVGSHVLQNLTKLAFSRYKLIDPDLLRVENIARHQFGFVDINKSKVSIAKGFLLQKNPFLEVITFDKSIIDLLEKNEFFFENDDLIVICIGITRYELSILDYLIKNNVSKPVLIFWVEAYLASGQMIYSKPEDLSKTKQLLTEFPYNALTSAETLREGSCQGTYLPYSLENINLFLSAVFFEIFNIVNGKEHKSMVYTWLGDLEFIKSKGINLTQFANGNESFTLYKNLII